MKLWNQLKQRKKGTNIPSKTSLKLIYSLKNQI